MDTNILLAEQVADGNHREYDAYHTERICNGVCRSERVIVCTRNVGDCLLCSTEPRGVGNGSRQNADHRGQILAR